MLKDKLSIIKAIKVIAVHSKQIKKEKMLKDRIKIG